MQTVEKYYFGQGRLLSRPYGTAGRASWTWWGDVSALTFEPSSESVRHRESYSGQKASVRKFDFLSECAINGTLHQLDAAALARMLNGTVNTVAGASVVGESLGTVAVGDEIRLDYPGISNLVITDSNATPATIYSQATPTAHFDVVPEWGALSCLSLPTSPAPTMPLLAAYTHGGSRQVSFLTSTPGSLELRYEGYNLAENGEAVVVEFYKVSSSLLQQLALITDGTDVAGTDFSLEALLDGSKPASGALGRFGRMIEVGAGA